MSSVVISGDVSGSVTLQAPSAAGTTVLTLPATSGTVVTTATSTGISGSAITTGTVGVSVGGTGANTLTANNVILGNGTSAVQFVAPGSSGNVLTSNGTTWTSAAAGGGQLQTEVFTAPGTWTKPASATQVRVTVVSGGGGGGGPSAPTLFGGAGGFGGYAKAIVPVSAPVAITVGSGGGPATSGGTSSFGSAVSCTGGVRGADGGPSSPGAPGANGTATISVGTALRASNASLINDNFIGGTSTNTGGATAYSTSGTFQAGASGAGGNPGSAPGKGGVGGAIVVEFVG